MSEMKLSASDWGTRKIVKERLCPECNKTFIPTKHRKKFCSLDCEEQYLGEM